MTNYIQLLQGFYTYSAVKQSCALSVYIRLRSTAGVCSYLGSRPDSAINDRMTAFVKLKGESFLAMTLPRLVQLTECMYLDMSSKCVRDSATINGGGGLSSRDASTETEWPVMFSAAVSGLSSIDRYLKRRLSDDAPKHLQQCIYVTGA